MDRDFANIKMISGCGVAECGERWLEPRTILGELSMSNEMAYSRVNLVHLGLDGWRSLNLPFFLGFWGKFTLLFLLERCDAKLGYAKLIASLLESGSSLGLNTF
jgi:hypothetical protein